MAGETEAPILIRADGTQAFPRKALAVPTTVINEDSQRLSWALLLLVVPYNLDFSSLILQLATPVAVNHEF